MESSTRITRLPASTARLGLCFMRTRQLARVLGGLDEGAADVVVADDAHLEGQAGCLGEAERRRARRSRAPARRRRPSTRLSSARRSAHALAHVVDRAAVHHAVGHGEIDVFEHAGPGLRGREGLDRLDAVAGDHHDLAVLDVAHELGADHVERAGLRRQHRLAVRGRPAPAGGCRADRARRSASCWSAPPGRSRPRSAPQRLDEAVDDLRASARARSGGGSPRSPRSTGRCAPSATSRSRRVRKLVRLPLWARATPPASRSANIGCTLRRTPAAGGGIAGVADGAAAGQALDQVGAGEGVGRRGPCGVRCRSPGRRSEAMPQASSPRCCRACRPSAVTALASRASNTPKTPHSSRRASSSASRLGMRWTSRGSDASSASSPRRVQDCARCILSCSRAACWSSRRRRVTERSDHAGATASASLRALRRERSSAPSADVAPDRIELGAARSRAACRSGGVTASMIRLTQRRAPPALAAAPKPAPRHAVERVRAPLVWCSCRVEAAADHASSRYRRRRTRPAWRRCRPTQAGWIACARDRVR